MERPEVLGDFHFGHLLPYTLKLLFYRIILISLPFFFVYTFEGCNFPISGFYVCDYPPHPADLHVVFPSSPRA